MDKAIDMVVISYFHQIRKAAFKKGVIIPNASLSINSDRKILTRLYLQPSLDNSLRKGMVQAMKEISFTALKVKKIVSESQIGGVIYVIYFSEYSSKCLL